MAAAYPFSINEFLNQIQGRPLDDIISILHRNLDSIMESWDLTDPDKIWFLQALLILEQVALVRDAQHPPPPLYLQPLRHCWCQCLEGNCCCHRCFPAMGQNQFLWGGQKCCPRCPCLRDL